MRRRTQRQSQRLGLTEEFFHALSTGWDMYGDLAQWRKNDGTFRIDAELVRAIWPEARARVLYEHREQYGAFSRPWGWWQFDATEPRNPTIDEGDQLVAMGVIAAGDLEEHRAKQRAMLCDDEQPEESIGDSMIQHGSEY